MSHKQTDGRHQFISWNCNQTKIVIVIVDTTLILVLDDKESFFVKKHSDSNGQYNEDHIIKLLEFLINIFSGTVVATDSQHSKGTICAQLVADNFLISYKAEFIYSVCSRREINMKLLG